MKDFLKDNLGLWGPVEVDRRGEASLKAVYDRTFGEGGNRDSNVQNLYSSNSSMVAEAVGYLNNASGFSWSHGAHTGSPVGLYVIGRGAEAFNTLTDNTQIAPTIAGLAGYKK